RRKEIQKNLDAKAASAAAGRKTEEAAVPAVPSPAPAPPKESAAEPAPVRTEPPVREAAPEPTVAPPVVRAPQREEVVRGDLVGPGAGVAEPELISTPHVTYPPIA